MTPPDFEKIRDLTLSYVKEHYPEVSGSIDTIKWTSTKRHQSSSGICYQYDSTEWTVSIGWTHDEPTVTVVACYNNVPTDYTIYWLDNADNFKHYKIVNIPLTFMWIGTIEGETITRGDNFILSSPENIRDLLIGYTANRYPSTAKYIDNLTWIEDGKITYSGYLITYGSEFYYSCRYHACRDEGDNWYIKIDYPYGPYTKPDRPWCGYTISGKMKIWDREDAYLEGYLPILVSM